MVARVRICGVGDLHTIRMVRVATRGRGASANALAAQARPATGSCAASGCHSCDCIGAYMDASRWQALLWCDERQIRLQVYIRPVCADRSLRALMDFADPRLNSRQSSKLGHQPRLGGSRSDLFPSHVVVLAQPFGVPSSVSDP